MGKREQRILIWAIITLILILVDTFKNEQDSLSMILNAMFIG